MKYSLFLFIGIVAYAEIVTMDDGTCYERRGNMNYVSSLRKSEDSRVS